LVRDPVTDQLEFAIRVPVARGGVIRYVLSAVVKPQVFGALLTPQRLPPDWIGVVLDADQRIVSRTIDPERSVASLPPRASKRDRALV
jgi:hypothetical protein